MDIMPKSKPFPLRQIFIKKMIYSALIQLIVFGLILILVKNYLFYNKINIISSKLLINDSYIINQIGQYKILDNQYALDLELNNLENERNLDSIKFTSNLINLQNYGKCENSSKTKYMICKTENGSFTGISPVQVAGNILGYIIAAKKYNSTLFLPIIYDLVLILLTVAGVFLFNFLFLFLSIKNKIQKNTNLLLNFISSEYNPNEEVEAVSIAEYVQISGKFAAERDKIALLEREKTYFEARKNIAEQVAHDIRSPLAALEVVIKRLPEVEESKRILLREAVNHIRDITNNLEKNTAVDTNYDEKTITNIAILLDYVLSERRAAFTTQPIEIKHEFHNDCYKLFVDVIPSDLKRVLANIINNACEATLSNGGVVSVSITSEEGFVIITITDNGSGISKETLELLFTRGVTTKSSGSGLGLYHAKESLANWNGTINLISLEIGGTSAQIKLPLQKLPSWFISNLSFINDSTVICVDDSISIYHAWREKFNTINGKVDLRYCSSKKDLLCELQMQGKKPCTYMIDYEFSGSNYTGLDLIDIVLSSNILHNRVFLVTSRSNENKLQELCKLKGILMIPKLFALKMDLQILMTMPKIIILMPFLDYQKFLTNNSLCIKGALFYYEINNLLADLALFDQSSLILIYTKLFDSLLEETLKKQGFTSRVFYNLENLISLCNTTINIT